MRSRPSSQTPWAAKGNAGDKQREATPAPAPLTGQGGRCWAKKETCNGHFGQDVAPHCLPPLHPPYTCIASQQRCKEEEKKKAKPSLSVALEKRRRLSKYSWCFDDKTFDRNMNDTNTLISSLRSFNSNYESRGVSVGSSWSDAPGGML